MEKQESRIAISIRKEKSKVEGLTLRNFKTYHKATAIKTWYWWKYRQMHQWNRQESPETVPHKHNPLVFDKGAKAA